MSTGAAVRDARIDEVVLAIGRSGPLTVDKLSTFTKVNLLKQYNALRYIGLDVRIAAIPSA